MDKFKGIKEKISQVDSPQNYFEGSTAVTLEFPQNLLLFERSTPEELGNESFYHHRFALMFVIETGGQFILESNHMDFKAGEAMLIFPYQFHYYPEPRPESFCWIYLSFELQYTDFLKPLFSKFVPITPRIVHYLELLIDDYADIPKRLERIASVMRLTSQILHELLYAIPEQEVELLPTRPTFVEEVNRYINDNIDQKLTIARLASQFSYSESHFRNLYQKHMKLSLGAYIQAVRLGKAISLLMRTSSNVSEISSQCGYDSVYAFSRIFKKKIGLSPLHYRQQQFKSLSTEKS